MDVPDMFSSSNIPYTATIAENFEIELRVPPLSQMGCFPVSRVSDLLNVQKFHSKNDLSTVG